MPLRKGDSGSNVKAFQEQLLRLGYALPRWGADGDLGDETVGAANEFANEHGLTESDEQVGDDVLEAVAQLVGLPNRDGEPEDHTVKHAVPKPQWAYPRAWSAITGITLHQTACDLGEKAARWYSVPVQLGVTKAGAIFLLNRLTLNLPHANALNATTVGIEIDGRYAGVEDDLKTYWRPPGDTTSKPQRAPDAQLGAARAAVRWVCEEVARHGGQIASLYAHRQASRYRQADPGSRIWQEVGLWAQAELGLSDGGDGFTNGGLALPKVWDPARTAKY